MSELPQILTPAQVGDTFGIAEFSVLERVRTGEWPHFRIGRKVLFTAEHVAQIVALSEKRPRVEPAAAPASHGQRTRGSRSA